MPILKENETIKTIKKRRAIRDYETSKDVPDELVYEIIEAGGYAPSAENQQPWRVIVVRDKKLQRFIGQIAVDRTIELFGRATPREEIERRLSYIRAKPSLERVIDILVTGKRFEYIKGESETNGAPVLLSGIVRFQDSIKEDDVVAIITLNGEMIGFGKAKMDWKQMSVHKKGFAIKTDRIIMKKGTYPRMWKR